MTSSQGEDIGQRLEAKHLQAAEQKRLCIMAKAQMGLSKLDDYYDVIFHHLRLQS
ncbi:T-complex protein 11-like protein 1 [Senna tora]|uniref:T-complex protein 11-like protein 1 n=1 Tax=Senna tora TaxID=362788 RepID=A0A834THA9_9FABA|nr:T-complex protein 11-like protein 1 [Senna tora]